MEILTTIVFFIFLCGMIVSPFFILHKINRRYVKYRFIAYLTSGIIITATIALIFGWWADTSDQILLSNYGYDFGAMNNSERFAKVTSENMERVKSLEISIMGIAWPLKAFITYIFYSPYLVIVYLINYIVERNKVKKENISKTVISI